jgi:hypothetical protein
MCTYYVLRDEKKVLSSNHHLDTTAIVSSLSLMESSVFKSIYYRNMYFLIY